MMTVLYWSILLLVLFRLPALSPAYQTGVTLSTPHAIIDSSRGRRFRPVPMSPTQYWSDWSKEITMMFDTTGLTEIKMRKYKGRQGSYFVDLKSPEICVAKTCSDCDEVLPQGDFGKTYSARYWLKSNCRQCARKYALEVNNRPSSDGKFTHSAEASRRSRKKNSLRTEEHIHKDRESSRPSGKKVCAECRDNIDLGLYGRNRCRTDGLDIVCLRCRRAITTYKYSRKFVEYWELCNIPLECYLCGGPYEEIEHLIPKSRGGDVSPKNTRPSCYQCNRGPGGKHDSPLEEYIFYVNHPTKSRAQVLHEIVMSGTWPFTKTSPEGFLLSILC